MGMIKALIYMKNVTCKYEEEKLKMKIWKQKQKIKRKGEKIVTYRQSIECQLSMLKAIIHDSLLHVNLEFYQSAFIYI